MVELQDVSLLLAAKSQELVLLGDINAVFAPGELVAVVGGHGSGKSTLLKLLAGIRKPTFGEVIWTDENAAMVHSHTAVAYLPQTTRSTACKHNLLTVSERVQTALHLRVAGLSASDRREQVTALLEKTGLGPLADRRIHTLSASQERLLDLTTELAGSPALLLCDEAAVAFDPKTESAFADLLRTVARKDSLPVIHVTHALDSLEGYDSVLVLHGGQLAFQGSPEFLTHYFALSSAVDLYDHLATRRPDDWHRSWIKHGQSYRSPEGRRKLLSETSEKGLWPFGDKQREHPEAPAEEAIQPGNRATLPGAFSQCLTLLKRRLLLACRNPAAAGMQWALLLGFPLAVAFFAAGDLAHLQELSGQLKGNVAEQLKENAVFAVNATHGVRLVAGLGVAQALLIAFMAAQNAAREIAGERMTFEREKLRGLRVGAYVASKALFLLPVVLAQSAWMGWYVKCVCRLPGNLWMQIAALALVNAALTSLCLAVSSLTRVAYRSMPACLCLAAAQLPLSGAVLMPPELFSWIARPLGTLYWGASAYLQSIQGTRFYEVIQVVTPLPLLPPALCLAVLGSQIVLGLLLTTSGCKIARLGDNAHALH